MGKPIPYHKINYQRKPMGQRKSSIVFEYHTKPVVGYFFHNSREKPTVNSIFDSKENYTNLSARKTIQEFVKELEKRENEYTKRTGRKTQDKMIRHISSIVNLDKHHTEEDLKKVIKYLEDTLDTKVIQYSIHKDEGYIDEETREKHINYHAHIEMLGIDSKGYSIRRKINRKYLIDLQTKVSELLGMERGTSRKITKKRRLNTYEYKEHIKRQKEIEKPLKNSNKIVSKKYRKIKEENAKLKKRIQKLEMENLKLKEELELTKEEVRKNNRLLKDIRQYIKTINQGLQLFVKEDYSKISEIQKKLRKYDYTTLTELRENINQLIRHFMKKIQYYEELSEEKRETIINELSSYYLE